METCVVSQFRGQARATAEQHRAGHRQKRSASHGSHTFTPSGIDGGADGRGSSGDALDAVSTKYDPLIIDRRLLTRPVMATIPTWMTKNSMSAIIPPKCQIRANCRPPNSAGSQWNQLSIVGESASPERMMIGVTMKTTPK